MSGMRGTNWLTDAGAAFALARSSGRPLFLYWGAAWCPPCNRLKGTVFADPAFAALAGGFVALHADGDGEGAQALAGSLCVRSYPTLIVYRPDGVEITRLPCELAAPRFIAALALALAARHTADESLQAALSGARVLADVEWRLLAAYSWDTDEDRLLQGRALCDIAARLRELCPLPDAAIRFDWHALHAGALADAVIGEADIARLRKLLADPLAAPDLVTGCADDLLAVSGAATLLAQWSAALALIEADTMAHLVDRLAALRVRLRIGGGATGLAGADEDLLAAALHAPHSAPIRHQLVNTAAGLLASAGRPGAAMALLSEELGRSHAPYYFMHSLAALARQQGDLKASLDWYERAWQAAAGPATRLQWGATYLLALLDMARADGERIERMAAALHTVLGQMPDAHSQRNRTQCERLCAALAAWRGTGPHTAALRQVLDR